MRNESLKRGLQRNKGSNHRDPSALGAEGDRGAPERLLERFGACSEEFHLGAMRRK